jgi:hypothetical protein
MKTNKTNIKISADILAELEALPKKGNTKIPWSEEMEAVMREYYPVTSARSLAPILTKLAGRPITISCIYRKSEEMGMK